MAAQNIAVATMAIPSPKPCWARPSGCPPIVTTDAYSRSGGFSGYADPSARQDTQTGTYWKAYTWPHVVTGGVQVSDIHLAFSTDGGATWTYKGAMYTSQAVTDPVNSATDYTSHEVVNLVSWVSNGVTQWAVIHSYFSVTNASGHNIVTGSKRFLLDTTTDPDGTNGPLGVTSPSQSTFLATNSTNVCSGCTTGPAGSWPYDTNMASLASDVSGCQEFWEPWLNWRGNVLRLGLNCQAAGGALAFYAIYSTPMVTASSAPTWSYVSGGASSHPFSTMTESGQACLAVSTAAFCNAHPTNLTQMDVREDGLEVVASVVFYAPAKTLLGWVVIPLASISPFGFQYAAGHLKVLRAATSPDSVDVGGGSCTVAPNLPLICAHKIVNGTAGTSNCSTTAPCDNGMGVNNGLFTYFMNTGIRTTPGHSVLLAWTNSVTPGVIGYNVYRGLVSGGPYLKLNLSGLVQSGYLDRNVASGQTYFYVSTAFDGTNESSYSNEASALIP